MGESASGRAVPAEPGMPGFVLPFLLLAVLLILHPVLGLDPRVEFALRAVVVGGAIVLFSWPLAGRRAVKPWLSAGLGVVVFVVWLAPDWLYPAWHHLWPFENVITGRLTNAIGDASRRDPVLIGLRSLQAVVLVPIAEELFWRGFLMRWLIDRDFRAVAFGSYTAPSFWISAVLFGSEHGTLWDVGLLAGVIYNWWALHTRNLTDCIIAHAVTNAVLCVYIVITSRWEYWA